MFESKFRRIWSCCDSRLLVCIILGLYALNKYRRYRSMPPGPFGLPFIGLLYFLSKCHNVHEQYMNLSKKYGKIFTVNLGLKNLIILSDPKMIKEAFTKEEFSGRPSNEFYKLLGGYGEYLLSINFV